MHEMSICRALMAKIEEVARANDARSVVAVRLGIGPLSGVEPRLVAAAFPLVGAGTRAEGSHLEIETMPVRVRCRDCGAETEASPNRLLCGACGAHATELLGGDELLLLSVELETRDEPAEPSHV